MENSTYSAWQRKEKENENYLPATSSSFVLFKKRATRKTDYSLLTGGYLIENILNGFYYTDIYLQKKKKGGAGGDRATSYSSSSEKKLYSSSHSFVTIVTPSIKAVCPRSWSERRTFWRNENVTYSGGGNVRAIELVGWT